jgi:subtilisin family serine protease
MRAEKMNDAQVAKAAPIVTSESKNPGGNRPGDFSLNLLTRGGPEIIDWGLKMFSIPKEWQKTQGKGIKIAVLDTGIAYNHPDLSQAVIGIRDFTGSPFGAADLDGHGTHVAGILAARKDSQGVVGVAPKAELLIGKVVGDNGIGTHEQLSEGIWWAIGRNADIISISLESIEENPFVHAAIKEAVKNNIYVICAAGNNIYAEAEEDLYLDTVKYPGKYNETIAVGAIDQSFQTTRYSCRGHKVDIMAPGHQILSTYPPKSFAVLSGTSMAAPFVSGVVALMLAKHRDYGKRNNTQINTRSDLLEHLRKTVINLPMTGPESGLGFGLINPEDLLRPRTARFVPVTEPETTTDTSHLISKILKISLAVLAIAFTVYVLLKYVF